MNRWADRWKELLHQCYAICYVIMACVKNAEYKSTPNRKDLQSMWKCSQCISAEPCSKVRTHACHGESITATATTTCGNTLSEFLSSFQRGCADHQGTGSGRVRGIQWTGNKQPPSKWQMTSVSKILTRFWGVSGLSGDTLPLYCSQFLWICVKQLRDYSLWRLIIREPISYGVTQYIKVS